MFYLNCIVKEINENFLIVETNNIGYWGHKMFSKQLELNKNLILYVLNYKNEYVNELLFFTNKSERRLCEILLNIKNIGITTIKKIFLNIEYNNFLSICKDQDIICLIEKTKLSENVCKKIIQKVKTKIFNQKYNVKQMSVINSLNKLGYKISDIYKVIEKIDFKLSEEVILKQALSNLSIYEH